MKHLIDIYNTEKTCLYRGEIYRVRDNGAIFRCRKPNKSKRPLDEKWTFGNPNKQTGYMDIRLVAVGDKVAKTTIFSADKQQFSVCNFLRLGQVTDSGFKVFIRQL